ncbi:phosphohistidine phosphatase [Lishizhenia tianjinensis]|uniref:Phosphohistidine phosphatase n=1 Tax=Lishizhenia tianjinensis TaxID=477690 RepID=A0A1I6YTD9_9FLAO|nr:phosphoglycerate mutase family protein [Lishizhenia tianjinensis]SFT53735.1 phosphohistidine phosphatase [Lishizhenia tianjinensis]
MKLFLLRHAKTQKPGKNQDDFDRDLMEKGIKQCALLSDYFSSKNYNIPTVHCSTAQRTQHTYARIKNSLSSHQLHLHNELYLPSRTEMLKFVWEQKGGDDMMIIGHNNGISDLAMYFLDEPLMLSTGGLVVLEFPFESWAECSKATALCFDLYLPQVV